MFLFLPERFVAAALTRLLGLDIAEERVAEVVEIERFIFPQVGVDVVDIGVLEDGDNVSLLESLELGVDKPVPFVEYPARINVLGLGGKDN